MKIAAFADSHLDEKLDLEDNVRVHLDLVRQIAAWEPDLIVHAGDLHNRKSSPEVRNAAAEILFGLACAAPVLLVRGNHDFPGDLDIYGRLEAPNPIHVADRLGMVALGGALLLLLPWIDKANVVAGLGLEDRTIDESSHDAIAAVRSALGTLTAWAEEAKRDGLLPVGVGHVMIGGSVVSTGQTMIGQGLELNAGDLVDTGAYAWILGHVHKSQAWNDVRVFYTGSPQRLNYGEPEPKCWWRVLVEPAGTTIEGVPTAAKRIERVEWDLDTVRQAIAAGAEGLVGPDGSAFEKADVRIRYTIRPEQLDQVDRAALERVVLEAGARRVKIEPVIEHEARVRVAEISSRRSTWDQILDYLRAQGRDLEPGVYDRLEAKLAELETGRAGGTDAAH